MESNFKRDNGGDTDKLSTFEEAVEKAGGLISIPQGIYITLNCQVFDSKKLLLLFRFWFVSLDFASCVWLGQR